ncbi:MAG: hypothetical protein HYU66_01605, partial [Armatimonadetes bacterium]|nr:hypothetical protein [Armatimonadota bacterium]
MPLSLLEYAAVHGWVAALIGLLCAWSATLSGGWVARWSWLLGLRREPPAGLARQLLPGVGAAL